MGVRDRIAESIVGDRIEAMEAAKATEIAEVERAYDDTLGLMQERLVELELALEDADWIRLGMDGEREFSSQARATIRRLSRIMYLKNPLIRRGVNVQVYYVFGQGVEITARSEMVNEVVEDFLGDPANRRILGVQALKDRERDLQTDGDIFLPVFVNPSRGTIKVSLIHADEITKVLCNPEDDSEPWYYQREWTRRTPDANGVERIENLKALYPAFDYRPVSFPPAYQGIGLAVDSGGQVVPLYHVRVGGVSGMKFGVSDVYAALDWARGYKTFLEDVASLFRSLSRWAWKATAGRASAKAVKERLGSTLNASTSDTNPSPSTGSIAVMPEGQDLTPIPKSGANVNAEDGKALRLMVAAALDIPDSILANDPQQGALATAKTLDRPTELAMKDRQDLWAEVFTDLLGYALEVSVEAPSGKARGKVTVLDTGQRIIDLEPEPVEEPDLSDGAEPGATITTSEPADPTIDVRFPPILVPDLKADMEALLLGLTMNDHSLSNGVPKIEALRLILELLNVPDADRILEKAAEEIAKMPEPPPSPFGPGGTQPPPGPNDQGGEQPPAPDASAPSEAYREAESALRTALVAMRNGDGAGS